MVSLQEKEKYSPQIDISTIYLNSPHEEEVYIKQSNGFIDENYSDKVLRLKEAIYTLSSQNVHGTLYWML